MGGVLTRDHEIRITIFEGRSMLRLVRRVSEVVVV